MAGKIIADTIETGAGADISTSYLVNGSAKAWVNFNGTGTVAVRESFSTSSITDVGTGTYTVNFSTAMTDANYSAGGMCNWNINGWGTVSFSSNNSGNPFSTTAVQIRTLEYATIYDSKFVTAQIFR
jgi:hypothetical protein